MPDKPSKATTSVVGFWIDSGTVERLKEYAVRIGLSYSQLWRGIFMSAMPTEEDMDKFMATLNKEQ